MRKINQIKFYEMHKENLFLDVKNRLESKGYSVVVMDDASQVRKFIDQNIPDEALVGLDGSEMINELDIPLYLRRKWNVIVDPFQKKVAKEIKDYLFKKLFVSEYFITCPDAITEDGKVVFKSRNNFLIKGNDVKPENIIAFVSGDAIIKDINETKMKLKTEDLTILELSPYGLKRGLIDNSGQIEEYRDMPDTAAEIDHDFTIVLLAEEHVY